MWRWSVPLCRGAAEMGDRSSELVPRGDSAETMAFTCLIEGYYGHFPRDLVWCDILSLNIKSRFLKNFIFLNM